MDGACPDAVGPLLILLLGKGAWTLPAGMTYPVGDSPTNMGAVDLNGEGNPELVGGSVSSSIVSVLLGVGDGTFQARVDYAVPSPWGVAVADVNGDGIPDVVATSLQGGVALLQGVGDGRLLPAVSTRKPAAYHLLAVCDLTGHGVLERDVPNLSDGHLAVPQASRCAYRPQPRRRPPPRQWPSASSLSRDTSRLSQLRLCSQPRPVL